MRAERHDIRKYEKDKYSNKVLTFFILAISI